MNVFLSHARKDGTLARQLADCLSRAGFTIWIADDEIVPGENWAKKIGKALDAAEWMVILLTPRALESDSVRQDIEFALASRKLEGRVFTVFVGPTLQAGKDIPWILLTLPHQQVDSAKDFPEVAKEIQTLASGSSTSHSNA
ncbi:MAG TPA: toll/interleukin-1 receptor domain-containing protein [Pirellulales bacterium]|nr:toll/interleukin-1 receptor domain-containing protein [Pirellulales bacterium]